MHLPVNSTHLCQSITFDGEVTSSIYFDKYKPLKLTKRLLNDTKSFREFMSGIVGVIEALLSGRDSVTND